MNSSSSSSGPMTMFQEHFRENMKYCLETCTANYASQQETLCVGDKWNRPASPPTVELQFSQDNENHQRKYNMKPEEQEYFDSLAKECLRSPSVLESSSLSFAGHFDYNHLIH